MNNHIPWPSIESFHHIRKAVAAYPHICNGNQHVTYKSKIKLHGSNAAIQLIPIEEPARWCDLPFFKLVTQSRTQIITPENDNAGFSKWVHNNEDQWKSTIPWHGLSHEFNGNNIKSICIQGEWVGSGVQKGCAIHKLDKRIFAVFALMIVMQNKDDVSTHFIVEPAEIQSYLPEIDNVYVLPWNDSETVTVNWLNSSEELQPVVDGLNKTVEIVEQCDPWVKSTFGVEGIGEGLVYYPVSPEHLSLKSFGNLAFKAKGEAHRNIKTATPVQINPETAASVEKFVELVLTEARLKQGASEVALISETYEAKQTGKFISWIMCDVEKETKDELAASGLTWAQIQKALKTKAALWFLAQTKRL